MASAIGGVVGGLVQAGSSIAGYGARKREAKAAAQELTAQKAAFDNFQLTNEFAGMENTAEDLTVNTQASNFQAQQTDAALAQGLDAIVAGGGGGGSAQAIAAAALQSKQGISANIAQQEARNQMLRAQQAASNQMTTLQAADDLQLREYDRTQQKYNLAAGRKLASDEARTNATSQLVSGIGAVAGGVGGSLGGVFGTDKGKDGVSKIGGALKGIFG